ncbi:transporter substrate-binding domain-containing protein [Bradyrhizobium sp. CCGUVB1N3]|uniref:transporter substrate-binding domain-containing protein n=1 Tax=Bradyrhizobium sp. CCGUVB1N3 TaxID=2949629 RepID=UPI0020B3390E|nr:transporter substrate-binding domain-containing protein [Bradyrhizobium sp. CCGUVB1N3]MCP3468928.1 transporter substrate-binding domain-containing protein [Bradyrhizobium sp. CCGUVB1N3]
MISRRQFSLLAVGIGLTLATPASAADLELIQPGKLLVATQGTFAPFSMRGPDGELDGLEIRVVKEIARRLKLEYSPVISQFDAALVGLLAGQYDMTSVSMDITAARQKQVTFADGWLASGAMILTRKQTGIRTGEDLKGKNVGTVAASTFGKIAEQNGATLKSYKAEVDAVQDLVNENLDAVVTDAVAANYAIKARKLPLVTGEGTLSQVQKGFAIQKGKPNLTKAINGALADMIADGTYAKLTSDLIGFDPHPKEPIRSEL